MKNESENAKILLGRRIRSLRNSIGLTQQELGNRADINYKFLGEVERGQQNPSFEILRRIAEALEIELTEMLRFEQEILVREDIEERIKQIVESIPDDMLRQLLMLLRVLFPIQKRHSSDDAV